MIDSITSIDKFMMREVLRRARRREILLRFAENVAVYAVLTALSVGFWFVLYRLLTGL